MDWYVENNYLSNFTLVFVSFFNFPWQPGSKNDAILVPLLFIVLPNFKKAFIFNF